VQGVARRLGEHSLSGLAAGTEARGNGKFNPMIPEYFLAETEVLRKAKSGSKKSLSPMLRRGRLLE
jgi:hypothetical protein